MAAPEDMIMPILREMRAEMASFRKEAGDRLSARGFDGVTYDYTSVSEVALRARSLGRRLQLLEQRVASLEAQK